MVKTKFQVGDIIKFHEHHIKPGTNRISVIKNIIDRNSLDTMYYKLGVSIEISSGPFFKIIDEFPDGCGLEELGIKIGYIKNLELFKLLHNYE